MILQYCCSGFPHSDICGSMDICSSPQLFAACHVLLRLLMPRHSSYALLRLTSSTQASLFPQIASAIWLLCFAASPLPKKTGFFRILSNSLLEQSLVLLLSSLRYYVSKCFFLFWYLVCFLTLCYPFLLSEKTFPYSFFFLQFSNNINIHFLKLLLYLWIFTFALFFIRAFSGMKPEKFTVKETFKQILSYLYRP